MATQYELIIHLDGSGASLSLSGVDTHVVAGHMYIQLRAVDVSNGQVLQNVFAGKQRDTVSPGVPTSSEVLFSYPNTPLSGAFIADESARYNKTVVGSPTYNPDITRFSYAVLLDVSEFNSAIARLGYLQQNTSTYTLIGDNCVDFVQNIYMNAGQTGHAGSLFSEAELAQGKFAGSYAAAAEKYYVGGDNLLSTKEFISEAAQSAKDGWDSTTGSIYNFFANLMNGTGDTTPAPTSSSNFFNIYNFANGGSIYDSPDWSLPNWQNGVAFDGGNYSLTLAPSILNGDGLFNVAPSYTLTNGIRPGEGWLSDFDFTHFLLEADQLLEENQSSINSNRLSALGDLNNYQGNANTIKNIDPLVLDINGNGIELKSYQDANVLFNMDTDSYKEQTGWVASTDGFLVHDKNSDGIINNITEMFSEFYTTGVSNGLQALTTLDSNSDGVFNSSDTAFGTVRVWQDANGNGQTDAGELKTLASLNITNISLNGTPGNGAVIEGNEVQATSTMTMNGVSRAVAAINLLANPAGHEWTISSQGVTINSEVGKTSFNVSDTNGATVNVATLGVNSAYGNVGNDTLIGDANSNWLGGGAGSDTITAGAGDDVLIIDAQDSQANIDGGAGFDIVQAVGAVGVNFNLSQSNIELATGTNSDDVLVGGGTASVFISGGGGNDIVIGSGANDSLSGNDGNDMLDGGYGDDIIRGHRGDDLIIGGFGNDILEGGLGNDVLNGGDGDDVLKGGGGTDTVDGGNGTDIVELTGSYSQYTRTVLTDGFHTDGG